MPLSLAFKKLKAYRQAVKRNDFVQALAYCPAKLRYRLPKQLWIANRLGLYRTILQQNNPTTLMLSKRARLAKTVAQLKYQPLTPEQAKVLIDTILQPAYAKWHLEFIKDIGFKYPEVIFDFIQINHEKNAYYHGLYLALLLNRLNQLNQYQHSSDLTDTFNRTLASFGEPVEKILLTSNGLATTSQAKLALLNESLIHFGLANLALKQDSGEFLIENLQPENLPKSASSQSIQHSKKEYRVTVLVTCYNAQDTIGYCVTSLLNQTWQNLEIIVIDDTSSDNTKLIVEALCKQDSRVKLIALPYNVGTYGAKNIGALQATGKYLTCQDADDFAHPQKIERQVQPLIDDATIAVTTSYWLRMDKNGQYYARHYYPFLRQNPASPMFRREQVQVDTGLWHLVRTGADSEFFERLKLVYGKQALLVIKQPLTLASHRENSLMTSIEFGVYEHQSAVDRLDYWENWRLWHIDTLATKQSLIMPTLQQHLQQTNIFETPQKITINKTNLAKNLQQFEYDKEFK